ncbi:hypothetical protein D3C81_2293810 [compost metagenome]
MVGRLQFGSSITMAYRIGKRPLFSGAVKNDSWLATHVSRNANMARNKFISHRYLITYFKLAASNRA